jgi:hypothetical protein
LKSGLALSQNAVCKIFKIQDHKQGTFKQLKKASAILLLFIFTFNWVCFLLVFKVQQYQVRQEIKLLIKQGMPYQELVQISVTAGNQNQLDWEHKKEFRYKGTMYDVVKTEVINEDSTIYYCITDEQETMLFVNLEEEVRKNMDSKNKGGNPIKNLFELLSIINTPPTKQPQVFLKVKEVVEYKISDFYLSPALNITSPPPKIV